MWLWMAFAFLKIDLVLRGWRAAAGLYVTFYYTGGSLGTVVTGWFWLAGGWPACVGLFAGVCLVTLALGLVCGHPLPDEKPASPVVDIAG